MSFSIRPPDFTTTLMYHQRAKVRDTESQEHWRTWGEAVRYWARKKKWRVSKKRNVEFVRGVPHIHVTLNIDSIDPDGVVDLDNVDLERELHALWKKAAKRKAAHGRYCAPVQTPAAWAKYVTKDLQGEKGDVELPPAGWKGRLTSSSPGFYAKPKEELYDDLKRSWGYAVEPKGKKVKKPKPIQKVRPPYVPGDDVEVIGGPVPVMDKEQGVPTPALADLAVERDAHQGQWSSKDTFRRSCVSCFMDCHAAFVCPVSLTLTISFNQGRLRSRTTSPFTRSWLWCRRPLPSRTSPCSGLRHPCNSAPMPRCRGP